MDRGDSFSPEWPGNRAARRFMPHPGHFPDREPMTQDVLAIVFNYVMRQIRKAHLEDAARLYGDILCLLLLMRDFCPSSPHEPATFAYHPRLGAFHVIMTRIEKGESFGDVVEDSALAVIEGPVNAHGLDATIDVWVNYLFKFGMTLKNTNQHSALTRYFRIATHSLPRATAEYAMVRVYGSSQPLAARPQPSQHMRYFYKRFYKTSPGDCFEYMGYMRSIVAAYNAGIVARDAL